MTSLLAISALGFFLGMRHATDPDHVIAVTTIVSRHRSTAGAALVGVVWGLGHTLTILVVGGGIILLGWVIPARVGLSLELSVGVMLIVLGTLTLTGFTGRVQDNVEVDRRLGALRLYQLARPLVVGVVHGLAGSAAVALLVLATIDNAGWAMFYLLVFGAGTIVGMMLVTAVIAWPFAYTRRRLGRLNRGLRVASGVISLTFGLVLAYQIGVVDGLFGDTPQWTPH